ncbi:MAG: serine hydroxymethyltransferase [Candidatus Absconditabacteria bacterium]|nr:serine hydroxymethyltransferase [Candidatus Absconditabacteria bacterium]MDD3868075.1 serine hydroxymethyltransferase [Candidatus Absconditabacteria bacterium]MDD4714322.1 serine hydroxymethyltransferase [Candidatus Absconditabacteria bacterium]
MTNFIQSFDPEISQAIKQEEYRQNHGMELIASENYQSAAVLATQSSILANKYSEGFPGKRYYGGQENTDIVEQLAIDRAKQLFKADHANVQALSGAAANLAFYSAVMEPGDAILGMDLSHGGHLTHGSPVTFFSKVFNFQRYKTLSNGKIDFNQLRSLAHEFKPKVILAGFSAYPRELEYDKFAEIANEVGAILYADISHVGGFIAAGILKNPFDYGFHAAMTTTHKSLRGPRGALILSKGIVSNPLKKPEDTIENIPTRIDRAVFPGMQGGPHMNTIAAIAVALKEAQTPDFLDYAKQTLINAKTLAEEMLKYGYKLVTGGTDNHMIIVDFSGTNLDGKIAEDTLDKIGISTSKSTIPDDPNPPSRPSGLRIGMPAMTTRGIKAEGTKYIASFIHQALQTVDHPEKLVQLKKEVEAFATQYPVPLFVIN